VNFPNGIDIPISNGKGNLVITTDVGPDYGLLDAGTYTMYISYHVHGGEVYVEDVPCTFVIDPM
jgi:hypothetical protein